MIITIAIITMSTTIVTTLIITTTIIIIRTGMPLPTILTEGLLLRNLQVITIPMIPGPDPRGTKIVALQRQIQVVVPEGEIREEGTPVTEIMETAATPVTMAMHTTTAITAIMPVGEILEEETPATEIMETAAILVTMAMPTIMEITEITLITATTPVPGQTRVIKISLPVSITGTGTAAEMLDLPMPGQEAQGQEVNPIMPIIPGTAMPHLHTRI